MNCPSCNNETAAGATFCNHCGANLNASTSGGAAAATAPAQASGLSDNAAGAIAYLTFIPAVIFLVMAPYNRNPFVRFHSFQCIFLTIAAIIVHLIVDFAFVGISWAIGMILSPLVSLFFLVVWIITILKASKGEWFKLPWIGDLAEQQARKA